jgi:glycosyltransferase involved in cell wall biosynthesis
VKIVVSIPAYNEAKSLGKVLSSIRDVMKKHKYGFQLLVVDDGSSDKTASVAAKAGAKVVTHPMNYGLAETFRTEMKTCLSLGGDIIVHIDADGQYLPSEIPKLIEKIEEGNDLVLGSRFLGTIESMPFMKRLGNKMFSRTISKIIGRKISDCQTGFRAFTSTIAKEVSIGSTHTYTQEQIIRAVKHKFKVCEVPVYFAKRDGESRLIKGPFEYAAKAWLNILRIYRDFNPLKFFGSIGIFLFSIGLLIGVWLTYLFFTTGKVGHIPSAILSMLLILTGIQILSFGFLSDMMRKG